MTTVYKPTRGLWLAAFFQATYSEMELSSDPDATKEPFCDISTLEDRHQNDQTVPSAPLSYGILSPGYRRHFS